MYMYVRVYVNIVYLVGGTRLTVYLYVCLFVMQCDIKAQLMMLLMLRLAD